MSAGYIRELHKINCVLLVVLRDRHLAPSVSELNWQLCYQRLDSFYDFVQAQVTNAIEPGISEWMSDVPAQRNPLLHYINAPQCIWSEHIAEVSLSLQGV